jgi:hypothetical protein
MGCVCKKCLDDAMPKLSEKLRACVFRGYSQDVQESPSVRQLPDSRRNVYDASCRSKRQRSGREHIGVHCRREFLGDALRVTQNCNNEPPRGEEERHMQVIMREGLLEVHCGLVRLE